MCHWVERLAMWIIDPAEALAVIKFKARSRPLSVLSGNGAYAHKRKEPTAMKAAAVNRRGDSRRPP